MSTVSDDTVMMVTGPQLLRAADDLGELQTARLRNGVTVTHAQIRRASEILRNGPQPVCNGITSDMPGFIDAERQKPYVLVLQVGILPSRCYEIDPSGTASSVPNEGGQAVSDLRERERSVGPRLMTVGEQLALLDVEEVLVAARPLLGMSVSNSLGARADRALTLVAQARAASSVPNETP